jgi:integrase
MPKYKKETNRLVELEEAQQIVGNCHLPSHKVCVALLYISGARPAELVELKKKSFRVVGSDVHITMPTKKKGYERVLPFDIEETSFLKDLILPYIEALPSPDSWILPFRTPTRIKQIIYMASKGQLCPYNFRHNRLSQLGLIGASLQELMNFKGARDPDSVMPYLYRNPAALEGIKRKIK